VSVPKTPDPALLVLSILGAEWDRFWPQLKDDLEDLFGPVEYATAPLAFAYTTYYDRELGTPIARRILGFERLADHESLADVKLATNALETRYARADGSRTCNLDPGFLTQERLVLATGKNFTHRVYLKKGVFADLTLIYQADAWVSLPWTFRDYAAKETQEHLYALRSLYRRKLDNLKNNA